MPEMQLSWQPGYSLSRKPMKRPTPRRKRRQRFEFVMENGQRPHRSRCSPSVTPLTDSGPISSSSRKNCMTGGTSRFFCEMEAVENNRLVVKPSLGASSSELFPNLTIPHLSFRNIQDQSVSPPSPENTTSECSPAFTKPSTMANSAFTDILSSYVTSVPPTIQYGSLTQRFKPMLNRYNAEFCTIPLTFNLRINPFRYRLDLDPEPTFLVHAVMALAGHHVNSTTTLSHRHAALQLLQQTLREFKDAETMYSLLDTIIILFSLDETQSLLGSWTTHLAGAYSLIEACGGIQTLAMSSRVEAQIGLLTWWDAITSLLSREHPVFPYTYFNAVLSNQHKREWDFFGLCGCPTSLAKIVMQVARLGAAKEKSALMLGSTFDDILISEIEQSLESWRHIVAETAFQDEARMHQDQDVMHCSEAWRNGLLLYLFRVFQWQPGASVPPHVSYRARAILDHVVSCRDVNMVSRQALLPLFFAGCELRDQSTQAEIVKFCSTWDERTKYHMFRSTIPLLKEIWAEQETKGFENVWWGQVVDKQHKSMEHPLQMRLCFG